MSTITKERAELKAFITGFLSDPMHDDKSSNSLTAGVFRIALASLEAEPVAYVDPFAFHNFSVYRAGETDNKRMGREWMWANPGAGLIPVYTSPLAPVTINAEPVAWLWSHRKHPSEVSLVRPEDDERADGAHWSGWSCQALYEAPPVPVSVPELTALDKLAGEMLTHAMNCERRVAVAYTHCAHRLAEEVRDLRAAMLQGAEPVSQPCTLPDGYCVMPLKLTSENGAKGALSGEFHVTNRIVCQSCAGEGCEDCNDEGGWDAEIPVSWDTIKRIHEAAVEACSLPAAPQQEV